MAVGHDDGLDRVAVPQLPEVLDRAVYLRYLPAREEDPRCRRPDITLARQWLGWQPTVSLQDGLIDTIAAFRADHTYR